MGAYEPLPRQGARLSPARLRKERLPLPQGIVRPAEPLGAHHPRRLAERSRPAGAKLSLSGETGRFPAVGHHAGKRERYPRHGVFQRNRIPAGAYATNHPLSRPFVSAVPDLPAMETG